jgi:putative CocE/NonD family hydrolase
MDHWLKGVDNEATKAAPVRYFLMGDTMRKGAPGNVWKQADQWPVPNSPTSFYLTEDGGLRPAAPKPKNASRTYAYDSKNPVPMMGGNNMGENKGPIDQRKLAGREDILRFQTDALTEPVEVTGKVLVDLYVSADVPDTTLMAKLVDVYPNGYQALVLDNTLMARYHDGFAKPAPLEKGKVYKLSLYLWNTALVFDKGHRIAVHISGSNAPRYEVHPNSFQPVGSYDGAPVAHVAVQTSAQYPSRLILPVIR